ncbi:hypothetical protein EZS27_019981 [termite gut metagenome]|uniref:Uncharacterized protein n=1 Tax=termite gut metagenome TaxID=433724 RepID=A0A5J4RDH2_9ZZZZ
MLFIRYISISGSILAYGIKIGRKNTDLPSLLYDFIHHSLLSFTLSLRLKIEKYRCLIKKA